MVPARARVVVWMLGCSVPIPFAQDTLPSFDPRHLAHLGSLIVVQAPLFNISGMDAIDGSTLSYSMNMYAPHIPL